MVRVRRRLVFLDGARLEPQFLHDAGDRFLGYPNALLAQDLSDLRAAVQATRVHKDTANLLFQFSATFLSLAFRASSPLIVTAPGYVQNLGLLH